MESGVVSVAAFIRNTLSDCMFVDGICGICSICGVGIGSGSANNRCFGRPEKCLDPGIQDPFLFYPTPL